MNLTSYSAVKKTYHMLREVLSLNLVIGFHWWNFHMEISENVSYEINLSEYDIFG